MPQRLHQLIRSSVPKNSPSRDSAIQLEGVAAPVRCLFNDRARRYRLGLDRSGNPRLTIPRRGTLSEGKRFAEQHVPWLKRQVERRAAILLRQTDYTSGTGIMFRGSLCHFRIEGVEHDLVVCFAGESIPLPKNGPPSVADCRGRVLCWMRALAARELPTRTREFALRHGLNVARVAVRNQRTRWGSCSDRRVISLNWRLVQTPESARDYIILHELMHLREMNHSKRYWKLVSDACPDYPNAEAWLKANNSILASGD